MRVLVCGGRDYKNNTTSHKNNTTFHKILDHIHKTDGISCIINGCATGADRLGLSFALVHGLPCKTYKADWNTHGRRAGPIRNALMLKDGAPDLVIALPGGRGTANMVRKATKAGVPVLTVNPDGSSALGI
jgi:hypothetical protein